jgi:UDP-2,3-diacylglucosamine hydrolase
MAKVFFVSDIHIKWPNDERHKKFLSFLDLVLKKGASHLFILGDLFEFFYGKPDYIVKKYHGIFNKLEELSLSGVKIHYLYGNHDFSFGHIASFISVEEQISAIELGGKKLSAFHGDGIDPSDVKYRILKRFLRGKLFWLFASIIPDPVLYGLASLFSGLSRNINLSTRSKKLSGWEPYRQKALSLLENSDLDMVVYAHTHVAELSILKEVLTPSSTCQKVYVNTGFFGRDGTYCMMSDDVVCVGVFEN